MYEDSNRNKTNMIGEYLKLHYDINDEKAGGCVHGDPH